MPELPALPLPEPLRASEIPSFTHTSVVVRLPDIGRRTLADLSANPHASARLQALIDEIPAGPIREPDIPLYEWATDWRTYVQPYLGMNWLDIPWFFAEEYFYLRVVEASGYFHPGAGRGIDPYASQKRLGLVTSGESIQRLARQVEHALSLPPETRFDSLERLLLADLWGNQNDLSMWPVSEDGNGYSGGASASSPGSQASEFILANHTGRLIAYLSGLDPAKTCVDFILDNAGYELAADLAIADFLLSSGLAGQVRFYTKTYPVFVSDALIVDIHDTIDWLCQRRDAAARAMAVRLRLDLLSERLTLTSHPFWTSPLPAWEMPEDLRAELGRSALIISKGDANYRRLLGDRHWPLNTPFEQVVTYLPAACLAIRTCKSEIAVGISEDKIPAAPPDWIYNGSYGLIQFAR